MFRIFSAPSSLRSSPERSSDTAVDAHESAPGLSRSGFVWRRGAGAAALSLIVSCTSAGTSPVRLAEGDATANGVSNSIVMTGAMSRGRSSHTATALRDGRVLIIGGMENEGAYHNTAEIYDPATARFTATGNLNAPRLDHSATLLGDGRVLIAGGYNRECLATAEIYDPATGQFAATGPMTESRDDCVAVLLKNGKVLIAGGVGNGWKFQDTAEIFDPGTGTFTRTGSMTTARTAHTATLLADGRVLVAGGHKGRRSDMNVLSSCELYDPATAKFTATGSMAIARHKHGAALLASGDVLIIAGSDARDWDGRYDSAEIYSARLGTFRPAGKLNAARHKLFGAVVTLKNGKVLVACGNERAEVYDPATNSFALVNGQFTAPLSFSTATLLRDGRVLIAGGYDLRIRTTANAWVYAP